MITLDDIDQMRLNWSKEDLVIVLRLTEAREQKWHDKLMILSGKIDDLQSLVKEIFHEKS